jgi:hypothetical protein
VRIQHDQYHYYQQQYNHAVNHNHDIEYHQRHFYATNHHNVEHHLLDIVHEHHFVNHDFLLSRE